MASQQDLGRIMTAEQGKPFPEAKGEVAYGASEEVLLILVMIVRPDGLFAGKLRAALSYRLSTSP